MDNYLIGVGLCCRHLSAFAFADQDSPPGSRGQLFDSHSGRHVLGGGLGTAHSGRVLDRPELGKDF